VVPIMTLPATTPRARNTCGRERVQEIPASPGHREMLRCAAEEDKGLMDEIRTPWRMRYIAQTSRSAGCVFCPPPGEPYRERFVLCRGATAFVILNLYPYSTGHLLLVPYRHLPRFQDLTKEERSEIARLLQRSEHILRTATGAKRFHAGINLGRAGGAGVEGHLHVHLVPHNTRGDWQDHPSADEPALPMEEVFRRLAPYFDSPAISAP
jgi:ATP adenylyltransferase